ncbi:NADH:ubiquinone reductase (Na(+)-transporting) subunit D [Oceanotoga sp. DSM 15011]|jgi:Na+-transporting NADH:ubiquinone oxidoreductase subunit D|uniref:Na+-transporting NADH:ubiquinone oxidoreductase subunit D n=1 Tax=Oceanotoga teriensis TaxID=515440 RepID=A0AA45C912_9BACT|nr:MULTISPECIES: NADH:ubiquinone reductase (Na(+)-transporting) subunit D [Oceanotoga]MDN5341635.1 Na+-transporting NADH:ubiquinone oxidoreductase subunit [Oceanotoga sp.]MDO7977162.1 NADH:ubiquinone reductase (Na(+)-transporting) subunit D [Oceanotoga teriensis]PWJ96567.1 Na+-transporting NADH:ubiquinone oxidoreductase subunit D [Oceanotoga teriensis]UYP00259.1 NADH:ubiquinone reductase (Na(+)-transporting) subunit D [Oceanotoga sp. DSM 15011]
MAQYKTILKDNLWNNNAIFVQILGICSTLAVTNRLENTLIMSIGVILVMGFTNFTISSIKSLIPRKVRMIVQTLIISFYVIIVDIILKAFLPDISRALGPYVGLIITNCIIMGRAEAFAQSNKPFISFWDGITSGTGYMYVLLTIAFFRELLGFGTIFGFQIMPENFIKWTIMVMPPSAFFMLAIFIWIVKGIMSKKEAE